MTQPLPVQTDARAPRALGFEFAPMSPLSKRPPHAVPRDEMAAEIAQELADRCSLYPRLVAKGSMNAADATRHIETMAAIGADLPAEGGGPMYGQGYDWDAKIRELRRELSLRRNAWPKRIIKPGDPLDEATAARRMERLDAVHFLYWIELFQCDQWTKGATLADTLDQVRAWVWRVEAWERECLACPERSRWVRPRMIPFYTAIDRGDALERNIWNAQLAAAVKHGFAEAREAA